MLECRAQPIGAKIPYAHFTICRASDDCACTNRSDGCARAINSADDVDKDDGLDTVLLGVAAEGRDDLPLAQADNAYSTIRSANNGNS
jgi:hypothetical protein